MRLKTVKIETENGPVVINEIDYDNKIHTLFEEKETKLSPETTEEKKIRLFQTLVDAGTEGDLTEKASVKKLQKAVDSLSG